MSDIVEPAQQLQTHAQEETQPVVSNNPSPPLASQPEAFAFATPAYFEAFAKQQVDNTTEILRQLKLNSEHISTQNAGWQALAKRCDDLQAELAALKASSNSKEASIGNIPKPAVVPPADLLPHWEEQLKHLCPSGPDSAVPRVMTDALRVHDLVGQTLWNSKHFAKFHELATLLSSFAYNAAYLNLLESVIRSACEEGTFDEDYRPIFNGLRASNELIARRATIIQCQALGDRYDETFVQYLEQQISLAESKGQLYSKDFASMFETFQGKLSSAMLAVYVKKGAYAKGLFSTPAPPAAGGESDASTSQGQKPRKAALKSQKKKKADTPSA